MNKAELITAAATTSGLQKQQVDAALDAITGVISDALGRGEDVKLVGFGHFSVTHREPRKGRNPRTGEEVTIAARKAPKFKASKELSVSVNR